ncbi:MAG TPA: hypothetical protein VHX37_13885 [Acidobacteriaceae bacterium]|nr:hypothetical protein [Acidobacteriaceae bacterium]
MAKHKYALIGPEIGAANVPVTKELVTYEGDSIRIEGEFLSIVDEGNDRTATIRLAEGQSVKRVD